MAGRVGRIAAATLVVATTGTGAAMASSGTAQAANPLITGKCDSAMSAKPGQAVQVNPSGLLGRAVPPVALGAAPADGSRTLSVPTNELLKDDSLLGLGGVLNKLTSSVGSTCDVVVNVVNDVQEPVAKSPVGDVTRRAGNAANDAGKDLGGTISGLIPGNGEEPPPESPPPGDGGPPPAPNPGGDNPGGGQDGPGGPPQRSPGGGGPGFGGLPFDQVPPLVPVDSYGSFGSAFGPGARYGNLPFVTSGLFDPGRASFGQQVPGFSPEFGRLGEQGKDDGVQNAGQAEAIGPGGTTGNDVGLPLLIAVLALSGVSASLVRTWVLRRAA